MESSLFARPRPLAELVAEEHTAWDQVLVEPEVFGTTDPGAIATAIDAWCRTELGAAVAGAVFYRVSIGCVAGLLLADARRVVVKVQRGSRSGAYLEACREIVSALHAAGFPAPEPIAGPARLGSAWASAERFDDRGEWRDAHDPAVRRIVAATLAALVHLARPFARHPALSGAWFSTVPDERPFPRPHTPLCDFEATGVGAGWIDELARDAKRLGRAIDAGDTVVGHFDWRVEHLRFDGDRVVTSYDWDSLHAEREPVVVGSAAHAFPADWGREDVQRTPSRDELDAFVADYEVGRGRPFEPAERRLAAAACVYALAYTARCNHALCPTEEGWNGDFRPLLRDHGRDMLVRGF